MSSEVLDPERELDETEPEPQDERVPVPEEEPVTAPESETLPEGPDLDPPGSGGGRPAEP